MIRANRDEFMRRRLEEARATVILQSGLRGRAARRMAAQKRKAIVDAARRETGLLVIQVRTDRTRHTVGLPIIHVRTN